MHDFLDTLMERNDFIVGKRIANVAWHKDDYTVRFIFEDGTSLLINSYGHYCDDAWLTFEFIAAEEAVNNA